MARVDSEPARKVGVCPFHGFDRRHDEAVIGTVEETISVGVHDDVGRVAVLMTTILRGELYAPVVRRRSEARGDPHPQ